MAAEDKRLRLFFTAGYTGALLACFICNLAIFHTLDWFWIVLTAVMTVFCLTDLPTMVGKNRLPVCLGAATGSLALLLLACWLYAGDQWVLGAAITVVCLALPWNWWAIWRFYGRHVPSLCMAVSAVLLAVGTVLEVRRGKR